MMPWLSVVTRTLTSEPVWPGVDTTSTSSSISYGIPWYSKEENHETNIPCCVISFFFKQNLTGYHSFIIVFFVVTKPRNCHEENKKLIESILFFHFLLAFRCFKYKSMRVSLVGHKKKRRVKVIQNDC